MALHKVRLVSCPHCHKQILPHVVCKYCGFYNGREVINVIARELKKKEKHKKSV